MGTAELQARFAAACADPQSVAYLEAVRTTPVVRDLLAQTLSFEWARAQLVYDDPAKTLDTSKRADLLLFPDLVRAIGQPQKSLDLVSPYFVPGEEGAAALAGHSSWSSGLHAKTLALDGERIFVGSFSFDPRSALLNTEMGVIIASPKLAGWLGEQFDSAIAQVAYEVKLGADGRSLEWIERTTQGEVRYETEPGTSWFQRRGVDVMSLLPIEWLL